jgi:hypothetical protein
MTPVSSVQKNGGGPEGSLRRDHSITVGTPSLLRAINERTVLELIHRQGPLSRAQTADRWPLGPPSPDAGRASGGRPGSRGWPLRGAAQRFYTRRTRLPAGSSASTLGVSGCAPRADIAGTIVSAREGQGRRAKALISQIGHRAPPRGRAEVQWAGESRSPWPRRLDLPGYVAMAPTFRSGAAPRRTVRDGSAQRQLRE